MRKMAEYIAESAIKTKLVEIERPMWVNTMRSDQKTGKWKAIVRGTQYQGSFDAVVIAHNGKCANRLASPMGVPLIYKTLTRLKLSANWVLMVAFNQSLGAPMEGAFIKNSDILSWAANNTAKLRINSGNNEIECWTLISTQKYGKANKVPQEAIPPEMAVRLTQEMLEEFAIKVLALNSRSELPSEIVYSKPQLWGAALPLNAPVDSSNGQNIECVWDSMGRVGIVGDWVAGGGSMEAAALSGIAMAECIAKEAQGQRQGSVGVNTSEGTIPGFANVKGEDIGVFPLSPSS